MSALTCPPLPAAAVSDLSGPIHACHFGPPSEPRCGWYHPAAQSSVGMAVLICPPIGDEAIAIYRGLRQLACDLAAAGMPTLRFDPAGTGDSADPVDVAEADQVDAWLQSVREAAQALQAASGARSLALIGVRNGSLIAAQAAAAIGNVAAMVALVPIRDGRSYLRECRLLRASLGHSEPGDGSVLAGGHRFNPLTARRLEGLDWRGGESPAVAAAAASPPRLALVIDRHDRPVGAGCADGLRAQGRVVTHEQHPDLGRLTTMAHQAYFPPTVASRIVDWLAAIEVAAGESRPDPSALRTGPARLKAFGADLLEENVQVCSGPVLAAVVTRRATLAVSGGCRGIVLLASGSERQVGPHRIFTLYARERAALHGDVVLRIDRAGIGDSEARPGVPENDPFDAAAVADVGAAVAYLRTVHGIGECSLVGFCAGAYHGWRSAVDGLGIDRLVSVNPVAYTAGDSRHADPRRAALQVALLADARRSVVDLQRWRQLLRGELRLRGIGIAVLGRARAEWKDAARRAARLARKPMADDLAVDLDRVDRRGVRQHFIFSAGEPGWTLLRKQGGGALKRLLRKGRVRVEHLAAADHSCTTEAAREALRLALHVALDAEADSGGTGHGRRPQVAPDAGIALHPARMTGRSV